MIAVVRENHANPQVALRWRPPLIMPMRPPHLPTLTCEGLPFPFPGPQRGGDGVCDGGVLSSTDRCNAVVLEIYQRQCMAALQSIFKQSQLRKFAIAIGTLTGPSVMGAALSFLSTPLLVGWFTPAQFGEAANALAAASILSGLVTLRIDMILYQPENAGQRPEVAKMGLVVSAFLSLALTVLFFPAAGLMRGAWNLASLLYSVQVCVLTLTLAASNIGTAYLVGESLYLLSGIPKIVTPLTIVGVSAIARWTGSIDNQTFLLANVAGSSAAAILYSVVPIRRSSGKVSGGVLPFLTNKKRYIFFAVAQSVVGTASLLNMFIMIVARCYGIAASGQIFMAYRIVAFPSAILGMAAGHLLASNIKHLRGLGMRKYLLGMAVLGIIVYLPLMLLAIMMPAQWIPMEWRESLDVAIPVIILCCAQFAIGSFGHLLLVWNKAHKFFIWDFARLVLTSAVALLCWRWGGSYMLATWYFVVSHLIMYGVLTIVLLREARYSEVVER